MHILRTWHKWMKCHHAIKDTFPLEFTVVQIVLLLFSVCKNKIREHNVYRKGPHKFKSELYIVHSLHNLQNVDSYLSILSIPCLWLYLVYGAITNFFLYTSYLMGNVIKMAAASTTSLDLFLVPNLGWLTRAPRSIFQLCLEAKLNPMPQCWQASVLNTETMARSKWHHPAYGIVCG